jgi:hypothetical protein
MKPVSRISIKDYSRAKLLLILLMFGILLAQAATPSPTLRTTTELNGPLPKALVLRGGTIFDSRQGLMQSDQIIIIRGERIEQAGPRRSFARPPPGARVLDARGKFIIPGLIDGHVHLVLQLDDAQLAGDEVPATKVCGINLKPSCRQGRDAQLALDAQAQMIFASRPGRRAT